jgi:hypothetical protein
MTTLALAGTFTVIQPDPVSTCGQTQLTGSKTPSTSTIATISQACRFERMIHPPFSSRRDIGWTIGFNCGFFRSHFLKVHDFVGGHLH